MVMLSRREYYPRFDRDEPPLEIHEAGEYLWEWYKDVERRLRRITEGICSPIPPSEWLAWQQLTRTIVYPWEYGILTAMDVAFCDELNKELEAKRASQAEDARKEAEQRGRRR